MRAITKVSIIIPIFNEADNLSRLFQNLTSLDPAPQQVILIDGGSTDSSTVIAQDLIKAVLSDTSSAIDWQVLESNAGRATQMNAGASLASGEVLLFLHADTQLPTQAIANITAAISIRATRTTAISTTAIRTAVWGRFDVQLDSNALMLRVVSQMINWRSRVSGIATGDQAIFIQRALFEQLGGYPDQALMEDIEISKRLKALAKPICLNRKVVTSARRWQQHGTWRTIVLMWQLRFDYWRGVSADHIRARYYKN